MLEEESRQLTKNKSGFKVITKKQLFEMMAKAGLDKKMDKVEVEQAVQFLHECGVLLHYDDIKSNLSDLYFLDPQWLCSIMSKVITIKQLTMISKGVCVCMYQWEFVFCNSKLRKISVQIILHCRKCSLVMSLLSVGNLVLIHTLDVYIHVYIIHVYLFYKPYFSVCIALEDPRHSLSTQRLSIPSGINSRIYKTIGMVSYTVHTGCTCTIRTLTLLLIFLLLVK